MPELASQELRPLGRGGLKTLHGVFQDAQDGAVGHAQLFSFLADERLQRGPDLEVPAARQRVDEPFVDDVEVGQDSSELEEVPDAVDFSLRVQVQVRARSTSPGRSFRSFGMLTQAEIRRTALRRPQGCSHVWNASARPLVAGWQFGQRFSVRIDAP
ncbi:hypothetical protein [Streptomyces sp. SID12488]|uniref:hypothetical protein n=1 Tax=Streptomyces sp. SID12488 TaxID=2706040 RepID=UPI0013D98486|nr:hypothetical protein [Streptomyces sp. SID12488]NEA68664.1 hypothetical protein [Streptomyces sp. SID12488]